MSIILSKGEKVNLTKDNPGLKKIIVGLGWDVNKYDGEKDFDLDAMAFMTNSSVKCPRDTCFISVFVPEAKQNDGTYSFENGAAIHSGDNRTGNGEGDDERITFDLTKMPQDIERIEIAVNIWEGPERHQNFGQVSNAYIRVLNAENNEEILRYDLGEDFSIETAVIMGALYKYNGEWKFDAIGSGFQNGLKALCENYGLNVG